VPHNPSPSPSTSPGLRDRKRSETRARIEEAAVSLVLAGGLEDTTVDAISEAADISPRTFFNYFDSKDSAILGLHADDVRDEAIADQLTQRSDDLVESVVRLLVSVVGGGTLTRAATLREDRLEVIRRHPHVLTGQFAQLTARASRIAETIEELMAGTAGLSVQAPDRPALAEMLMTTCGGALRIAVREWAADGSLSDSSQIERRAIALVKDIVGTLA
jgi:AcrR family transcriptional regulator